MQAPTEALLALGVSKDAIDAVPGGAPGSDVALVVFTSKEVGDLSEDSTCVALRSKGCGMFHTVGPYPGSGVYSSLLPALRRPHVIFLYDRKYEDRTGTDIANAVRLALNENSTADHFRRALIALGRLLCGDTLITGKDEGGDQNQTLGGEPVPEGLSAAEAARKAWGKD